MKRITKSRIDEGHFNFIRSLPCLKCSVFDQSECCHLRLGSDGGAGLKPSPWFCLPYCHECHMKQHRGERTWYKTEEGVIKARSLARLLYDCKKDWATAFDALRIYRQEIWA